METEPEVRGGEADGVSFVVTGFGPFCDAKQNPTSTIANKLIAYLRERDDEESAILASSTTTMVIETALEAAKKEVDGIYQQILGNKQKEDTTNHVYVVLHLGVNYRGENFELEQCAYNEADFRVPDERGHQPRNAPIAEGVAVGEPIRTELDVDALVQQLNVNLPDDKAGAKAVRSSDPGRFVCNYTYYYSMSKCSGHSNRIRCLFLHVPPFSVASEADQLRFVADLMAAIKLQVQKGAIKNGAVSPSLRGTKNAIVA